MDLTKLARKKFLEPPSAALIAAIAATDPAGITAAIAADPELETIKRLHVGGTHERNIAFPYLVGLIRLRTT